MAVTREFASWAEVAEVEKKYEQYQKLGGKTDIMTWQDKGMPADPVAEQMSDQALTAEKESKPTSGEPYQDQYGGIVNWDFNTKQPSSGMVTTSDGRVITWEAYRSEVKAYLDSLTTPTTPTTPITPTVNPAVGERIVEENGWYYRVSYDATGDEVSREVYGQVPSTPATTYPLATGREASTWDSSGNEYLWNTNTGQYEKTGNYDAARDISRQADLWTQNFQQQQFTYQQEQDQRAATDAQKQHLAELAADPLKWLQYSQEAGQTPAIQPWMLPLMPQQYSGSVAGGALPGWQGGTPNMSQLPALTTPSTQYAARMGPTAREQWYGYEQARTGATPQEQDWRMWTNAPPAGKSGLTYGS